MKIMIEIEEDYYKIIKHDVEHGMDYNPYVLIANGTPLPEQQSCEDCINRAEVLIFLKGFEILHNHDELRTNLIYGIMNLPSVTPHQTRWIPCSERLPKKFDYYLVTIKIEIPGLKPYYEVRSVKFGCFGNGNDFDIGYVGDDISVIAWMPQPEPYKEESEVMI